MAYSARETGKFNNDREIHKLRNNPWESAILVNLWGQEAIRRKFYPAFVFGAPMMA